MNLLNSVIDKVTVVFKKVIEIGKNPTKEQNAIALPFIVVIPVIMIVVLFKTFIMESAIGLLPFLLFLLFGYCCIVVFNFIINESNKIDSEIPPSTIN